MCYTLIKKEVFTLEWNKDTLGFIKEHYNKDMTIQEIADNLGSTYRAVQLKACRLELTNSRSKVGIEGIDYIKNNYKDTSTNKLAKHLGVNTKTVRIILNNLGLENPRSIHSQARKWTFEESKFLTENYQNLSLAVLALYLERTPKSVERKIATLGLEPKGRPKSCESALEVKMGRILKDLAIKFEREYPIGNKFMVDFYAPDYNLCIEVQGSYFHPRTIDNNSTDKQKVWFEKDQRKKKCILSQGYNLLCIFEDKFKNEGNLKSLIINNLPPNLVNCGEW